MLIDVVPCVGITRLYSHPGAVTATSWEGMGWGVRRWMEGRRGA